jgi:intracellular sulfur oxidation DsrE/DsrF family protein
MKFSFILLMLTVATAMQAQNPDNTPYKIVFQLTSADTAVQRAVIKQITNVLNAAPKSQIELVCHNAGISILVTEKTYQAEKIKMLRAQGVAFVACENTMRDRNIKREALVPEATTVPSGIVEIVKKQRKKWAYIKAG